MAAKNYVRENVPLSRFGVLVAQLESIAASAAQQPPESLLCFDLLSDLLSAIDEEPKDSILLWQRKCEDALYSLLILGARRPVRHLASVAMAQIILKGDGISIYSRASSLQGFLSDGKRTEPMRVAGAAQCLGELYHLFGRRITSGFLETTIIATKLMKFHEDYVRQEALHMLQNALEGSGGNAASSAYTEAFRLLMRFGVGDKSTIVRIAAARCLKAFANIGGPALGIGELDNAAAYCVKALEDTVSSVRDAFAEALGMVLALGMNPEAQVQPRGKGQSLPAKKFEGGLQRHLALPFAKASGVRSKDIRIGITLSWVFFLQAMRLRYMHPDSELQNYALQIMEMIRVDNSVDAQSLACILYILRVGITDQMTEPTQRSFLVFLAKQLQSRDISPSMEVAALHTLSYTLKTLGEVPLEFREVLDDTVLAAVSHSSQLVRIEAALTIRVLAEVDPTCVGGLVSYGLTILSALRDSVPFGKGSHLKVELDSLHGQATALAALVSISPKLPLGYPARFPLSVLESSKKMLTSATRNPVAAAAEEEAGWLLLSSLLVSMPKEELEDQVFDILSLWAPLFNGSVDSLHKITGDLELRVCVWSASIDALTGFVRCFLSPSSKDIGILLQPVLFYLSRALSYISFIAAKELPNMKHAVNMFIIRTLMAYQSLPDPLSYRSDHPQIIQLCTTPFRISSECEESSCLRLLLDKRDAWLGPWVPGRDWFEDELRAFQGGKDGLMPCAWEGELCSFPQPETISKTLVNQMLLCFGIIFASQDKGGMLSLIGMIEQCLRAGKKQSWHAASVTNICVGLVAGLKALLASRPQPIGLEILSSVQSIFQSILTEVDICPSQRRATSEGLGLLARLGNDIFTARMARSLLGDLASATDSNYAGSIAFTLGCIHRSAGGMALSTLVPATVSSISLLARSSTASLQIWSLHGLLLTIEAAGFSYVSHVQATLGLALDILLSEDNGLVDLQQGVGRLVNAIVAVLGPELSPGSIFFSRCKSVIMEISSCQETATLLESVRFTQQLVLFAPQAVSVHSHVKILLRTLSSRQPTLRHLAVSTLRHLIEKDPVSITDEQIENNLFHMLDEETDSEIGNLVRSTIMRLLYASCPLCPSHWILIFRTLALATMTGRSSGLNNMKQDLSNYPDGETKLDSGEDDENMVSNNKEIHMRSHAYNAFGDSAARDNHLRYRTRVFAAECLSHLPSAVGKNPAHFDLCLARNQSVDGKAYGDWLVLHLEELISLAYQISTVQFESMQPIGVGLLSTIMDKFGRVADPELPGHLLLEQYQAQLVSAVRTALDMSSGPILLEAGLRLATKILTSGIISGDQVAVRRIFSLISRPLNDFNDLYYPSFAEWVSCKIKVRLLAAHASLKCYSYAFLMRGDNGVPDEYVALLPLFSKSSSTLGKYWICVLKDYGYTCFRLHPNKNWKPFLDGIQSSLVSSKLRSCLEEAWPVILQAITLDAVPVDHNVNESSISNVGDSVRNSSISGYSMVKLELDDFQFVWGFALLVLFQRQPNLGAHILIPGSDEDPFEGDEKVISISMKLHEIVLPVFQFLSTKRFFSSGFLTLNICEEFLKVVSYSFNMEASWSTLAISVLSEIVQNCPESFLEEENIAFLATELCLAYIFKSFDSIQATNAEYPNWEGLISPLFSLARTIVSRCKIKQLNLHLAFLLIGYKCIRGASTELCFLKVTDYIHHVRSLLEKHVKENFETNENLVNKFYTIIGACLNVISTLTKDCVNGIDKVGVIRSELGKFLQLKLAFCIEQIMSFAELAHETGCQLVIKENATLYFRILKHCTESVKKILSNSNTQVIAITLQVLKNMAQRTTSAENKFLMFFLGELFPDIFTILRQMLKEPITKESITVAGECLRTLMLLQALSKTSECQKGLMNLLLEAILYIFGVSEKDFSQELNEIRSTAIRLVSHLAQIPASAAHFKDVLLAMPMTHREQLQGIIRASVAQDQNATDKKSPTPSLIIKLPVQTENYTEEIITSSSTLQTGKNSIHEKEEEEEEEEEEEDDWDTFQSFHASSTTPDNINSEVEKAPEELTLDKSPSVSDSNAKSDYFQEYFSSSPSDSVKDTDVEHHLVVDDEELISKSASESQSSHPDIVSSDNRSEDRDDQTLTVLRSVEHEILNDVKTDNIEQSSHHDMESSDSHTEDRDDKKIINNGDDHEVSTSDIHCVEDDQGFNKVGNALVEQGEEIQCDTIDDFQEPVNASAHEFSDYEHHLEPNDKVLIDQQHLDTDAENESNHPHKANSDSSGSLDSRDNSDKLRMSD